MIAAPPILDEPVLARLLVLGLLVSLRVCFRRHFETSGRLQRALSGFVEAFDRAI